MRGVLVKEWTEFDRLTIEELPRAALGARELRLATQAAGVSFATSLVVAGRYQRKPPLPFVPGTEAAGIVSEVGAEVTRFKPGDRVIAMLDWGGLAEEAVALEVNTFKIPDGLGFERAISFTNSYSTSAAALTWPHLLRVAAGETLLVHGAAGGVGLAAIEIGKLLGATVIATAGAAAKLQAAREHGADHAIDYRAGPFREQVLALTEGLGANAIYDPVGGDVFDQSLRCIAPEGRIMPVGFAGGRISVIPANILLVKNVTVCGLNMGFYAGWSPSDARYQYEGRMRLLMDRMFGWFNEGRVNPRIWRTFPLEGYKEAMAEVLGRAAIGRVAIVMGAEAKRLGH
ncbi:MAG: NADPH:quinone oxidoreductase family protein [Alphaproteobacteria bacterium]|nr:NADPH:quinone oxidoreductase family protein [Alphaproteobacteria bacterium]